MHGQLKNLLSGFGDNMAKLILGHISRNQDEIIEVLEKGGSYCCPTLPHYRYDRVKRVCSNLLKRGLVVKSGKTNEGINLIPSDRFRQWQKERDEGVTRLGPIKWVKQHFPKNEVKRKCRKCGCEFMTINHQQKQCSKQCKGNIITNAS